MINTRDIDQLTLDVVRKSISTKIVPLTHGAELEIDLKPHVRYIEAQIKLVFPATKPNTIVREVVIPRGWRDAWKLEHASKWYYRAMRWLGMLGPVNYRIVKLEVQYRHLLPRLKLPTLANEAMLEIQNVRVTEG